MTLHLNQGQVDEVNNGLRKLHDILPDFDKAEKCGIDCSEFRQFHKELFDQLTAIKQQFDLSTKVG